MTAPIDIVREFWPELPDVVLGWLLWNETPYPFGDERDIRVSMVNYCLIAAMRLPKPVDP